MFGLGASYERQDVNKDMTDWPAGRRQLGIYEREYCARSCVYSFRPCILAITWSMRL